MCKFLDHITIINVLVFKIVVLRVDMKDCVYKLLFIII